MTLNQKLTTDQKTVLRAFDTGSPYLEEGNKVDLDFLGHQNPSLAFAAAQLQQLGLITHDNRTNEMSLTPQGTRLLKVLSKGG